MLQFRKMGPILRWSWEKKKEEHARLENALVKQFSLAFGNDGLESWQSVCRVADRINRVPQSIKDCRSVSFFRSFA
jgi:hypothetical protein